MPDYGEDFYADDDLAEDLRTVTGVLVTEQAIWRRLSTPRGTLPSPLDPPDERDADYGTLIDDLLSLAQLPTGVFAIQSFVAGEVNKEDEVDATQTDVVVIVSKGVPATGQINITGATAVGPFSLVVGVSAFGTSAATVSLLSTGGQQ